MSALPAGWTELPLIEVCKKITDGTHRSPPNKATGEFKYVTAKNIRRHGLDLTDLTYASPEVHRGIYKRCPVELGDVLYIKDGATTGLAINNPLEEPFSLLSSVALLKPDRRVLDERYLRHWLNSPDTLASMIGQMSGSAIKRLTLTTISGQRLPLPPLAEQWRVVVKLDALTARTARARADLDRIPALAARYKQAVLAKAFSGELTAEWRRQKAVDGEAEDLRSQLLQQRTERRRAEGIRGAGANRSVPTDDRALPALPSTWAWMTFDQCSWDLTVGHVGPMKDRYVSDGIPFLRSLNVKPNSIALKKLVFVSNEFHAELRKSQLSAGTIVVIRTGEPGVAAVVPEELDGSNCSDLVICRPVQGLNPHFGARYINSDFAKSFVRDTQVGVAQQHFNVGAMGKLPVPIAPAQEQAEIVRRIDHAFAEIDRMVAEAAAARRLLDRLDQAILAKAFRGELVPQDPADEPASVLLDRIRADRAAAPKAKRGRKATAA